MAGGALQQHHHDKGKVIARVFEIKDVALKRLNKK
jgi:hypothetical protein